MLVWMCYKRSGLTIIGMSIQKETCQTSVKFLERIHKVHNIERENSKRVHVVRGEIDKDSNDYQTRSFMARILDKNK